MLTSVQRPPVVAVSLDPAVTAERAQAHAPPPAARFLQRGKLAALDDGGTRTHLTRASAVACIEEETMLGNEGVVLRHCVHVVHNSFAGEAVAVHVVRGPSAARGQQCRR